jgi:hypothetical protein
LPTACDRTWPIFEKCDFDIFDFVTPLTGSGNKILTFFLFQARDLASSFQKWNPHVDITSGSPRGARPVLLKRLFGPMFKNSPKIHFRSDRLPVWIFWRWTTRATRAPNLVKISRRLLCQMIFWSFRPPSCFLENGKFNFPVFLIECV